MNHGKINEKYYSKKIPRQVDIEEIYPEIGRIKRYFSKSPIKDRYYIAMKYHALSVVKSLYPNLVLEQLADIINVKTHSTVIHYMRSYNPLPDHNEFIEQNFKHFVEHGIYPITTTNKTEIEKYGAYKQVSLSGDEGKRVYKNSNKERK